jgi:uncharacterized OB-fold protein
MTATEAPRLVADPRPRIVGDGDRHVLLGGRCTACGHAVSRPLPRCPWCRSEVEPVQFGPEGAVWAVTVLHVAAGGRDVPDALAYVDLDDGPRLLVHLPERVPIAARVRLTAPTAAGDPAAEAVA